MLLRWLGMEHWPAEEKMRDLGTFSLEKGFLWRQLLTDSQCLQEDHQGKAKLFRVTCGNRMSDSRQMLKQERAKQVIRRSPFLRRTAELRNKFPRKALQPPSLEIFEMQLDKSLSNLVWPYSWPWITMVVWDALYMLYFLSFPLRTEAEIPTAVGFSLLALPPAEGGLTTKTQRGSIFPLAVSLQRRALVFSFHIYLEKPFGFWV